MKREELYACIQNRQPNICQIAVIQNGSEALQIFILKFL